MLRRNTAIVRFDHVGDEDSLRHARGSRLS
jgi:hypothetical protein